MKNLNCHFAGKEKIITLSLIILILSFTNIILCFSISSTVLALSYQTETDIGFTFNPTLSISLSSSNLAISNLTSGTTEDSNIINVSVLTNSSHGYTLSAAVGDSAHNDTNLTNSSNAFGSIATNANLENLTTDNTWGYSYKLSSSNAWSNYNGLPLYTTTSTTLVNTDNQISKPIDFKIAAKASSAQASGEYNNVINFIAVSKPTPKTIDDIVYMQTFGELVSTDLQSVKNSMIKNTTYILKDARDEQEYTIAKLNDGKIWMTKNLNLAGGTEITSELSDVPEGYTLPTANGFQEGNRLPESSQEGFSDNTQAYVYNTGNNTDNCSSPGCYSYYSWHAATAGSGINITTGNTDAPYSICPKGWKLPNTRTGTNSSADFRALMIAYGGLDTIETYDDSTSPTGSTIYSRIGPGTIANFLLTIANGHYWSSTLSINIRALNLRLRKSYIYSAETAFYRNDFSIRCLTR